MLLALMGMLMTGLSPVRHTALTSSAWTDSPRLRQSLDWASDQLLSFRSNKPELLQTPSTAYSVIVNLNRDLHLSSDALSNFSTDIIRRSARAINVAMRPMPQFPNPSFLLSSDGAYLRNTGGPTIPPGHLPFLSGTGCQMAKMNPLH